MRTPLSIGVLRASGVGLCASSSIERTQPAAQTKIALVADRAERKTPPAKKPTDAARQVPIPPGVIVLSATVNIEFELLEAN